MPSPSQRLCRNSGSSAAKVRCAEIFRPTRRSANSSRSQQNVADAERPKARNFVNFVSTVGNLFVLRPLDCSFLT
jgi:hypothetical protein